MALNGKARRGDWRRPGHRGVRCSRPGRARRHALPHRYPEREGGGRSRTSSVPWSGPVDISDPASARAMIEDAVERLDGVDCVVNVAGIDAPWLDPMDEDESHWRRIIDTDLSGPWWVTRAVLPHMRARGAGRIVTISSVSGLLGDPGIAPSYSAAKAGLVGLTVALSSRFEAEGILINAIAPGFMRHHRNSDSRGGGARLPATIPVGIRRTPTGRRCRLLPARRQRRLDKRRGHERDRRVVARPIATRIPRFAPERTLFRGSPRLRALRHGLSSERSWPLVRDSPPASFSCLSSPCAWRYRRSAYSP